MKYVDIPQTQLRVSQLCLGSTDIGATVSVPTSFALMDEFVTQGGNFIDTAHVYSNWISNTRGTSEKTIGQWLKSGGNRNQIVLATKGGHPELKTMQVSRLSPTEIVQDLMESLDYLQTDVIDLYWLHRDDPAVPVGEIVDVLAEQVQAGRVRYLGASNWSIPASSWRLITRHGQASPLLWQTSRCGVSPFPICRATLTTLIALDAAGIDFHRRTQMAVLAYSSQARGFFTKMDADGPSAVSKDDWRLFLTTKRILRLERCRELARRHAVSINEVVLSYLLSQPFPTIPILGSKRIDQLHTSLKALDLVLTPEELTYLAPTA